MSADIEEHTSLKQLLLHYSKLDEKGNLTRKQHIVDTTEEPGHDELCYLEQTCFINGIHNDLDLKDHLTEVVHTVSVVLASDQSVKTGEVVRL